MRATSWIISLFLATSLCTASAVAADAAPATLEEINAAPAATEHNMKDCPMMQGKAATEHDMKDCPMMQGKKECMHKKNEPCPCPNEQDEKHQGKLHEKCEYKKQG